jgi:hypothetical protein
MKTYGRINLQLHAFLTSTPDGGESSASRSSLFTSRERARSTHGSGSCVGCTVNLDALAKKKILAPAGNWTPAVQHIPSNYTDWVIMLTIMPSQINFKKMKKISLQCVEIHSITKCCDTKTSVTPVKRQCKTTQSVDVMKLLKTVIQTGSTVLWWWWETSYVRRCSITWRWLSSGLLHQVGW